MEAPQEYHTGRQISVFVWMQVRCWPESLVSPTEGHMTFTWGHLKTRVKFTRFQRFLLGYEKKVFNWQIQHCPLRLLAWALLLGSGHVKYVAWFLSIYFTKAWLFSLFFAFVYLGYFIWKKICSRIHFCFHESSL